MAAFLFKTEPKSYAFDDLVRDRRTVWDGVSNPVALRNLTSVRKGDTILIYHTGDEKAVIGLAVATSDPYPDPKRGDPKLTVVELEAGARLKRAVNLGEIKTDPVLRTLDMVRMPRLSIVPVSAAQLAQIRKLGS